MKRSMKRLSALFLALCLSLNLLGIGVWAADICEDDAGAPGGTYLEETEPVTEDTFDGLSEDLSEDEEDVTEEDGYEEESSEAQASGAAAETDGVEEGLEAGEALNDGAAEAVFDEEAEEETASGAEVQEEIPEASEEEIEEISDEKQNAGQAGDVASVTTAAGTTTYYSDFQAALAAWDDGCTLSPLVNYDITQDFTVPAGRTLEIPVGIEVGGTGVSITNNGSIVAAGTLNASGGTISKAGDVEVTSTGTLVIAAPLPATAEMMINAGGELKVAMPDGQGGIQTLTFIGKKGSQEAIAALAKGVIAFSLTQNGNTYTLGNGGILNVYNWDTGNQLFGTTAKTIVNNGTINVPGTMNIGQNTTLDNDEGVISVSGTLDATHGTISAAGDVDVNAGGTLVTAAPLPATAEMNINAGGELKVALPDGQGGIAVRTFIGKQGSTDAVAALAKGSIAFSLTAAGNTYALGDGGILNVYAWDTGNALFGTTQKTIVNMGTINVPGAMAIGENTTLDNDEGVISISGTLDATKGTISAAGDVDVVSGGTLVTAAPLPATAEMNIRAGGELKVALPDGQGGIAVRTFIGKQGSTDAIAALAKGSIAFSLTTAGNTYTLGKGGILNVYAWDTGNALFGTTQKTIVNKGTINVPGAMAIGENTTMDNSEGTIIVGGALDATLGTISAAGDVDVASTGTLVTAAPLPTTAEMSINAGGEFKVAMPDGQGGIVVRTFIGKQGSTDAIAVLAKGSIAFSLSDDDNVYTLGKGGILNVFAWDTGNALFGTKAKAIINKGTINVPGMMSIGQNTTLNNDVGVISIQGTLDATHGTISYAGDVDVASTGTLITFAPLPDAAEMNINAGGELQVVLPDGQGGTVVRTFIGKEGRTDAIATLEKGSIEFSLSEEGNVYTLKKGGVLNVYAWDTGNALFGTTKKTVRNKGSINVPGSLTIGQNTTLTNSGTITLKQKGAFVLVYEESKGELTVENSDGGVHSGSGADANTKYSYKLSQSAPAAPVVKTVTSTSFTVTKKSGLEYSLDKKAWQTSATFKGLKADTAYKVYARKAETEIYKASAASAATSVRTKKDPVLSLNSALSLSQTSGQLTSQWGAVQDATYYDVYVQYYDKTFAGNPTVTVKAGKSCKTVIKKLGGKALDPKKVYKAYVVARKGSTKLSTSITVFAAGSQSAKYTNVKSFKLEKSSFSIAKGKTARIKASSTLADKKRAQLPASYVKAYRYATSDKAVATVSTSGKITAKGKGTCTIYVYTQNGLSKKATVTVK